MVFSISEFPANIYTFITHGLGQASNIPRPSWHMFSPLRFYFFNLVSILCITIIPIHEPYFFQYMVLNTNITFETNLSILNITITKFISPNCHARKTSTTPVRFSNTLQLRFSQVTQLSDFYFSKKFFLLITSPRVLSWQVHLGWGFCTKRCTSIVKGSLIMNRLFPFLIRSE